MWVGQLLCVNVLLSCFFWSDGRTGPVVQHKQDVAAGQPPRKFMGSQ